MAFTFLINHLPTTGGAAIWRFKQFLVTQGWSVPRSGDGTNYNASGDVHAPGGTYAGSLDLSNAWFEIRQPVSASPRRSFLFQTPNTNGHTWRVWYSSNGTGFTTGGSASSRSTATDEQGIINTPSSSTQWLPSNASYRIEVIAGDSTEGFSFFFGARISDTNSGYSAVLSLDTLDEAEPLDADPAVIGTLFISDTRFAQSNSGLYNSTSTSQVNGSTFGWFQKGLAGPAFVSYPAVFIGGNEGFGTLVPINSDRLSQITDNSFPDFPIWYWRGGSTHTTQRGKKGRSRLYRASQPRYGIFRPNISLTKMSLGALSIPWDGSTIPIF